MRGFTDDDEPDVAIENVECFRQTARAILVRFDNGDERWIPQSVVAAGSEVWELGQQGTLVIRGWFAKAHDEHKAKGA